MLFSRVLSLVAGRERIFAYLVIALATALCCAVALTGGTGIRSKDEAAFLGIAQNLAATGMFALDPGTPTAYRAPGLVFFLTPIAHFGGGIIEGRVANALIFGLGLVLLFQIARRYAGELAGLLAVIMVPLWPVSLYSATTLYPQNLAAFLLVLTIWLIGRLEDRDSWGRRLLVGLAYGALILTTPVMLLLTPVFFIWVILRTRRSLMAGLTVCITAAVVVSLWTARNYVAFQAFVPVASSSGYNLLAGNSSNTRYNTSLNVRFPEYVYAEITDKSEIERDAIFSKAAVAEIRNDPERFVKLYAAKFLHWFHFSNRLLSDQVLEGKASSVSVGARDIVLFTTYCLTILLPLLLHLALMRRIPFRPVEILFFTLWIAAGLIYALYFTRVRFRLPFDWLVITSNAMFLAAWLEMRFPELLGRRPPDDR